MADPRLFSNQNNSQTDSKTSFPIKVIRVHFGGSGVSYGDESSCNLSMSVCMGELADTEIGLPVGICNCGCLVSCKADIRNIRDYSVDLKNITIDNKPIDFYGCSDGFYNLFEKIFKEQAVNFLHLGRFYVFNSNENQVDIEKIFESFIYNVREEKYYFDEGDFVTKKSKDAQLKLMFDDSGREKLVAWLDKVTVKNSPQL